MSVSGINVEAEFALLGALMFANEYVASVDGMLDAEHFADPLNAEIYRIIVDIVGQGGAAVPLTMHARLGPSEEYERRGGAAFLGNLIADAPPGANARDYAGVIREAWQRRSLNALARHAADLATRRTDLPISEVIEELEKQLLEITVSAKGATLVTAEEAVARTLEQLDNPSVSFGIETGLPPLDEALGGMMPGELWLLAGRPSMGKSALASCIALNVARSGFHPSGERLGVIEINAEMTIEQMTRRHLTDWAFDLSPRDAPSYSAMRKRKLTFEQAQLARHVAAEFRQLQTLRLLKKTGITISQLRSLIRRQMAAWKRQGIRLGLVTVDHGGLIRPDGPPSKRYEAQTDVAIALKEMADELGVPILVLVQLSRQVEQRDDKRPMLSDLRDSGAWEENADGVIMCFRPAYYAQRQTEPTKPIEKTLWEEAKASPTVEAILAKVREGQAGSVPLWGDMPRNAIRGSRPDSVYGDLGFNPPLGLQYVDASTAGSKAQDGPKTSNSAPPDDDRPSPPLEAYEPGEFD